MLRNTYTCVSRTARCIFCPKYTAHLRCFSSYDTSCSDVPDIAKRGSNLILMGSPGAGKTTVGQMVAQALAMNHIDVDNDHSEKVWGMTVVQKLSDVGSDGFIEVEGQALLQLHCTNTVISLSGSNPMHRQAMTHTHSMGIVFYLDVHDSDILSRLERMQVNRIVGQDDGSSIADILQFRKQFYEGSYDIRIICEANESVDSISRKVLQSVRQWRDTRAGGYVSTRQRPGVSEDMKTFFDVVLEGLASDGGLFVPDQKIPHMTLGQWSRLVPCTYQERTLRILEKWISPRHLHPTLLRQMISKAYQTNFQHKDIAPLVNLDEQFHIHELFHGPTASFKDLALQLTPHFFSEAIRSSSTRDDTKYLILVATSGDTGSAVLEGFAGSNRARVLVLYPNDGVSTIQRRQMVTADSPNVDVIAVDGDFDFCQSSIKQIFNDVFFGEKLQSEFNVQLSAANSINWGRLVPQIVYHASSYLELVKKGVVAMGDKADVCIPTGNFGNILAAYYAKEMGIPFEKIICASNENNILTEFFQDGVYDMRSRNLNRTVSPSIDILKSSNLERFLHHVTSSDTDLVPVAQLFQSLEKEGVFKISDKLRNTLSTIMESGWTDQESCLNTIKTVFSQTGYLLDPHTAVAKDVANRFVSHQKPMIISATAHYSKFAHDVLGALGSAPPSDDPLTLMRELHRVGPRPSMHSHLQGILHKPEIHKNICEAKVHTIQEYIKSIMAK